MRQGGRPAPERWQHIRALFDRALELPPEEVELTAELDSFLGETRGLIAIEERHFRRG